MRLISRWFEISPDNVNVHRAAANIIVSKSRAARGSVCNVLLSAEGADQFLPNGLLRPVCE